MKKLVIVLACLLVPAVALAQPAGSAAGSAEPAPAPTPTPGAPMEPPPEPAGLRKTCADAMNADPTFAEDILQLAYQVESKRCELVDEVAAKKRLQLDLEQHEKAAAAIAKNQKHVILAYAAMWIVAVLFVLFLWRRQQLLRTEIAQLKADLDAATKDGK